MYATCVGWKIVGYRNQPIRNIFCSRPGGGPALYTGFGSEEHHDCLSLPRKKALMSDLNDSLNNLGHACYHEVALYFIGGYQNSVPSDPFELKSRQMSTMIAVTKPYMGQATSKIYSIDKEDNSTNGDTTGGILSASKILWITFVIQKIVVSLTIKRQTPLASQV